MAGKTLSFFNLTGGLNTVQTMATINGTPNRTESPDMVNIEYFKLSGLKTMNGNKSLNQGNAIIPDVVTNNNAKITFGFEYILGNNRYMLVSNRYGDIYEYNPVNDTFTKLIKFTNAGDGITMCGFNNGVVIASPSNSYMLYYRKGGRGDTGFNITTTANSTTVTIIDGTTSLTGFNNATEIIHPGDMIVIDSVDYEVSTVSDSDFTFTVTVAVPTTYSSGDNVKLTLGQFAKIYCTFTSIVQDGENAVTTTTNFQPTVVQSHQGRIWVGTNNSYLIYSDLGDIHGFEGGDASAKDGGYFQEFWEDNSDIVAVGTWDKYIVCHKREHTYLIDTSNSDSSQWNVQSYSDYTCNNQRGFVKANNGYYTYCATVGGIYPMIQRTIYSAISQGSEASTKIRDAFLNLSTNRLDEIYAVYHPYKKYIMFYMPMIGENGSNNVYILDLQTKSWLHRRVPQIVTTAFEFNDKVYIGTLDGKVIEEFRGQDFDGEPIQFSWKSPWFIWGGATNWTTTREVRVKMSQEGTNNFYIRNRRDGNEDYKERYVTNTTGKVVSLLWDDGYLSGDETTPYIYSYPIYSYTGADSNTYYALASTLDIYTPMWKGTPPSKVGMYGSTACGALGYLDTGDADNYDSVEWGTSTVFGFRYTPTLPQYVCYRNTQNQNIKAWLTRDASTLDIDTTKAIVNVETKTTLVGITLSGVQFRLSPELLSAIETAQAGGSRGVYRSGTYPNDFLAYNSNTQKWWNTRKEGSVTYGTDIFINRRASGSNPPANFDGGVYTTDGKNYLDLPSYHGQSALTRNTANNVVEEVWNGQSTRSGKTKVVTSYSDTSIVIEGVTYERYATGDEGNLDNTANNVIVYANTETLQVGQIVYEDSSLTSVYDTVSGVSDTGYTISGRVFVADSSENVAGVDTTYYLTKPVFPDPDSETGTSTGTTLYGFIRSTDTSADTEKKLTDTIWADGRDDATAIDEDLTYQETTYGNTWVNQGQITKRFPIDRQYFQTLQIEFCGETLTQGIELYGFEIDGIQLTEVPW